MVTPNRIGKRTCEKQRLPGNGESPRPSTLRCSLTVDLSAPKRFSIRSTVLTVAEKGEGCVDVERFAITLLAGRVVWSEHPIHTVKFEWIEVNPLELD